MAPGRGTLAGSPLPEPAIPRTGAHLSAGARVVLPTSLESWNAGLRAAPSLSAGVGRTFLGVAWSYELRAVKYFHAQTTAPIVPLYLFYALVHIVPMTIGFANWIAVQLWGKRLYHDHYEPTRPLRPASLEEIELHRRLS